MQYYLGILAGLPLLPLLYRDGRRIRASVPKLPAAANPTGTAGKGKRRLYLLTLGESTVAGVGVSDHKEGITGVLAEYLADKTDSEIIWRAEARSGYTMQKIADEILPAIRPFSPNLIIVGTGANDAFAANNPAKFARATEKLIKHLQNEYSNAPIIFLNMPPIREFPAFTPLIKFFIGSLTELNGKVLENVIRRYENVHYISEKITMRDWIHKTEGTNSMTDFFSDGVHPSGLTYRIWAEETGKYILDRKICEVYPTL